MQSDDRNYTRKGIIYGWKNLRCRIVTAKDKGKNI